jgi:uncharacterized protein (UPF0332 family)
VNQQDVEAFLAKAEESLRSAESDFAHQRYNSCANRCYYACFQAAVAVLGNAGMLTRGQSGRWSHEYVQASFAGQLIKQRKLYPSRLKNVLPTIQELRNLADYQPAPVPRKEAERNLRRCNEFVLAIRQGVLK